MQIMSLELLFRATRQGLPGARERLFEGAQIRLSRYFSGRLGTKDVGDLVQETMMIALTKLDQVEPDRSFERWLLGVAHNVTLREYESRHRRARLADALAHEPVKPPTGPSTALLRAEKREVLLEEIQQLPEGMRVVIEHDLIDGDPAELAEAQQIHQGTVRTRRNRAISQLTQSVPARLEERPVSKLTDSSSHQES
jgi:RNA polymerase sigma factor (sigma-70 family)